MKCTFAVYVHHTPTRRFIISFMSFRHGAIIYNLPDHIIQPTWAGLAHRGAKKCIFPPSYWNGYQKYASISGLWIVAIVELRICISCIYFCSLSSISPLLPFLLFIVAPPPPATTSALCDVSCVYVSCGVLKGNPNHSDFSLNDYSDLWPWLQPWSPRRRSS